MLGNSNKRLWLTRITIFFVALLFLLFLFIFFRGIAWSPNTTETKSSQLNVGSTTLIRQEGQRLWATRLSDKQRKELVDLNPFVFTGDGCATQEICLIQSETSQQGVIVIYIDKKPDALTPETKWLGGFIDPSNGAIYDLLGRLYRDSAYSASVKNTTVNDIKKFINH